MSSVARLPSEAEGQAWETEDDDTAEGDLGYGLGRRPGGIFEVPVSHLFKSRKRSDGKNSSPPLFSRNGDKRNGAIFQSSALVGQAPGALTLPLGSQPPGSREKLYFLSHWPLGLSLRLLPMPACLATPAECPVVPESGHAARAPGSGAQKGNQVPSHPQGHLL